MKHLNVDRRAIEASVPHLPVKGTSPVIRGGCGLFGRWAGVYGDIFVAMSAPMAFGEETTIICG